jgi:hypothetical protein
MHVIFLHAPHIDDDVGVVLLKCVDIGEWGLKIYAGPVKILEVGFPECRFTELWPPHLLREHMAEPSCAHCVLETQVVCLRCRSLTSLLGDVNADEAMLGSDRIGGWNERPTTSVGFLFDTGHDCLDADHFCVVSFAKFLYFVVHCYLKPLLNHFADILLTRKFIKSFYNCVVDTHVVEPSAKLIRARS